MEKYTLNETSVRTAKNFGINNELEEAFDIEIDAEYVTEENFGNKDCIIALIKSLTKNIN